MDVAAANKMYDSTPIPHSAVPLISDVVVLTVLPASGYLTGPKHYLPRRPLSAAAVSHFVSFEPTGADSATGNESLSVELDPAVVSSASPVPAGSASAAAAVPLDCYEFHIAYSST